MNRKLALLTTLIAVCCLPRLAAADIINIGNQKLKDLIEQGVAVIDLRRTEEWDKTGVIDGSHLLTFFDKAGRYDAKQWISALSDKVGTDEPVVLICHSGVRSSIVGKWLAEQKQTVYNVEEGIVSWLKDGNATVKPTMEPATVAPSKE
jgi:rhodanese-related sulfurtransferase